MDYAGLREVANRLQELQETIEEAEVVAGPSGNTGRGDADDDVAYSWNQNFSTFTGRAEVYARTPGPTQGSQDPVELFMNIWDQALMEKVVEETNRYAWQTIAALSERGEISANLDTWEDTTVPEMYQYFSVLIYMALDYRSHIPEY